MKKSMLISVSSCGEYIVFSWRFKTNVLEWCQHVCFPSSSFSQDGPVIYKDKTEVDFEAVDVEGEAKRRSGVMNRTSAIFNPLLPPRLHFNEEMMQSINDVK